MRSHCAANELNSARLEFHREQEIERHTRLTYRFQGRDYRLTDVAGNVTHGLIA
jgi:hypothetical protein